MDALLLAITAPDDLLDMLRPVSAEALPALQKSYDIADA
jgi:hypothetical protein